MVRPEEFDEVRQPGRTTVKRARAFFEAQRKRFDESQRMAAYQSADALPALSAEEEEVDFSPEEAQRLLWEGEEMRQPVIGYRILEQLGKGGSATIFRALETATGQHHALKLLYPGLDDNQQAVTRFAREGMTLIRLDCDYILRGHDFGFSKGFFFQVLELVEGRGTVQDVLDRGQSIPPRTALRIVRQVARALAYLEGQQLVHRDIKPANLLIYRGRRVKLCDFGLCWDRSQPPDESERGRTCGTVCYMSPEQARGRDDLDVRCDLYSLGATLYQMIARRPPFVGDSAREVMQQQVEAPLDFSTSPRFAKAPGLRALIEKLMAKRREERCQSAAELLAELDRLI